MVVDVSAFRADLEVSLEKMDTHVHEATKEGLELALAEIVSQWPVHSYYSLRNTYITRNVPAENPQPAERPKQRNALVGEAFAQIDKNYDDIRNFKFNKTKPTNIFLSNAVYYADDVGYEPGRGSAIYELAANLARSLIDERLLEDFLGSPR